MAAGDAQAVSPIVVGSDDGLQLYTSLDAVLKQVEWIDVEDGVYGPAFDAAGHRVTLTVTCPEPPASRWAFWRPSATPRVEGTVDLAAPADPDGLVALLRERLPSEEHDLAALIDQAVARFGIDR